MTDGIAMKSKFGSDIYRDIDGTADKRGRGGSLDRYDIHFDKEAERFERKLVKTGGE